MKLPVHENKQLEPGHYYGNIIDIKDKPINKVGKESYEYIEIEVETEGLTLRASYLKWVSESSMLGKLLQRFGLNITPGGEVELDELIGSPCQFTVIEEKGKDGNTYTNISRETLSPQKKTSKEKQ